MSPLANKEYRMSLYARTLEIWEKGEEENSGGLCFTLHDLLNKDYPDWVYWNFFYADGYYGFPELWEQRTDKMASATDEWFNSREERIQALKNILNK